MPDTTLQNRYRESFSRFEQSLDGEAAALQGARREALERFTAMGFPTVRQEEWRFTNVGPLAAAEFAPVLAYDASGLTAEMVRRHMLPQEGAIVLVFVNGLWSREFSRIGTLPPGVRVESLAAALARRDERTAAELGTLVSPAENAFTALNTAFLRDGAVITLGPGVTLDRPVQILYLSHPLRTPHAAYPRTLVLADRESRLSLIESFAASSDGVSLTDAVTEVIAGPGAVVEHERLQSESLQAFHVGTTTIRQQRGSAVSSNAMAAGAALARHTLTAVLAEQGCECTFNGLSIAAGTQLIDNHTVIDHAAPHCTSHELYKAVLDGRSRGVFNGKIFVRRDAQKTDAKQTNKTLLLSGEATINAKPQLEIFADDVKCTHGATVGQLNEEQLFYLRTRGIGREEARNILTYAFAADVVSRIRVAPLQNQLTRLLRHRLQSGRIATTP